MPPVGPWTGPGLDREFAASSPWYAGDVLEVQLRDDAGAPQGHGLLVVQRESAGGDGYVCELMCTEDEYYSWYLDHGGLANPGLYRPARDPGESPNGSSGQELVTVVAQWRVLNGDGLPPRLNLGWLKGRWGAEAEKKVGEALDALSASKGAAPATPVDGPATAKGQALAPVLPAAGPAGHFEEDLAALRRSLDRGPAPAKGRGRSPWKRGDCSPPREAEPGRATDDGRTSAARGGAARIAQAGPRVGRPAPTAARPGCATSARSRAT